MIELGTLAGLLANRHELAAYCPRCDTWRVLPLAAMVAAGQGARRLPLAVRCRDCGQVGRLQVRPPVPVREAGGWMEPH
jgi:RNase P subunit RPR2